MRPRTATLDRQHALIAYAREVCEADVRVRYARLERSAADAGPVGGRDAPVALPAGGTAAWAAAARLRISGNGEVRTRAMRA